MHSMITEHGANDHNERSYRIQIKKMDRIVTMTVRHVRVAPILTEHYLRDLISKHTYKYICKGDLFRQYEQNMRPNRVNTSNYECAPEDRKCNVISLKCSNTDVV